MAPFGFGDPKRVSISRHALVRVVDGSDIMCIVLEFCEPTWCAYGDSWKRASCPGVASNVTGCLGQGTVPSQSQPDAWNDWQGLNERTLPREGTQVTHATCDRDLRFRVKPWKAMALGWKSFTRGRKSVGQARRRRCQQRIVLQG
ncbi:uncharacterized protein B0T23DRAFT_322450 [Neurospora hispaniola]|uniref:Uncharacterized protein n=1 Tax=Neurospora hispaniola TaxID=588809 RepID=A0AAJ0I2Q0_9PEZI|nr:hypothetical protein B0T23DRAFT_322450 [Neurospora hispaniola]